MGAPGYAYICEKGHLYHWIEEHLSWDDEMFNESKKIKDDGCPCGAKCKFELAHYGAIGDCLCLNNDPDYPQILRFDIINKSGKFAVYDVELIEKLIKKMKLK